MKYFTYSHSLNTNRLDRLCSKISNTHSKTKRYVIPFPDMNRFLSRHHKIHTNIKGSTESTNLKQDIHAYLCSLSNNVDELTNFMNVFVEEHGQEPAFDIFETCEATSKRDVGNVQYNNVLKICSSRLNKRWRDKVEGPITIDFINQMLEARKVKTYPYSAETDPYLVGK